jgi:hypothetical protein
MADQKRIDALLNEAFYLMSEARGDKHKGRMRAIRRGWQYGGGKKKAAKVGIGLAIGGITLAVSLGTGGAGLPLIAGLAVGAFAASQLSDAGFAKLAGRQYRGAQRTTSWIDEYRNMSPQAQQDSVKTLDERAHKTVRRAFQHYRKASSKAEKAKTAFANVQGQDATCEDLANLVCATLSVSHHLDKARLYAHPSIFMCQLLLKIYDDDRAGWNTIEGGLAKAVGAHIDLHQGKSCGASACYAVGTHGIGWPADHPEIWAQADVQHLTTKLSELEALLQDAPISTPPNRRLHQTRELWNDAKTKYEQRDHIVIKHAITNAWSRKTMKEKVSYGIGKGVSVGLSGTSFGLAGGLDAVGADTGFFDILVELGFQSAEFGAGEIIDAKMGDDSTDGPGDLLQPHRKWKPPTQDLDRQSARARVAASTQDEMRKAAIHLYEIHKIKLALTDLDDDGDDCDVTVEKIRQLYKIEHHLAKTQEYLHQTALMLNQFVRQLANKIKACNKLEKSVWKECDRVIGGSNHGACAALGSKIRFDINPRGAQSPYICYGVTPPKRV